MPKEMPAPPTENIRRNILKQGIHTFSAAVGTTAIIMLTLCGILDTIFPPDEPQNYAASALAAIEEPKIDRVRLGGDVFGIRMFSDGIIVASLSEIYTENGNKCPAKDAGIEAGDYILSANGQTVSSNTELAAILSAGKTTELTMRREDAIYTTTLSPVYCEGTYRAGMWIRDSAAGIGTVTYYSEDGRSFGALGHGICDADTRTLLALREGEPAPIIICGIERSKPGAPGRLRGYFASPEPAGKLISNTPLGVFGTRLQPHESELVEILPSEEVKTGPVQIAATIDDRGVKMFEAEIECISRKDGQDSKSMILHITDPELLEKTGGIVQGMSGSPILQDGKLVGALTHVFVEDSSRGYGIFIENMMEAEQ